MNGRRVIGVLAGMLLAAGLSSAAAIPSASADDAGSGVGITVTVSPAPDAAGGGSGSSSGAGGGVSKSSGTSPAPSTVVTGGSNGAAATPAADEFDLGGIVFVSGVTSSYSWEPDPLGGQLHAEFRVHNVSQYTIDSTAGFQLVNPFGGEITRVDGIRIDQLKPDESRVVDATLTGVGQWAFLTTHATFTPPESVGGTALSSLTRDGFEFVLPWFVLVLLVLGVGAGAVVALVRGARSDPLGNSAPPGGSAEPAVLAGRSV